MFLQSAPHTFFFGPWGSPVVLCGHFGVLNSPLHRAFVLKFLFARSAGDFIFQCSVFGAALLGGVNFRGVRCSFPSLSELRFNIFIVSLSTCCWRHNCGCLGQTQRLLPPLLLLASSDGNLGVEFGFQAGSRLDPGWIQPGSKLDPSWIQPGSRLLDPGWIQPGSRLDPGWMQPGSRLDSAWGRRY